MTARCALLLGVLACGLASSVIAPRPFVSELLAQDGGDGGEEKKKEKTAEEKELIAIGKEFAKKDSEALLKRLPEKRKVRLILGPKNDERYGHEQAKQVLDTWFESRSITKVKLTKSSGTVGEFQLKLRRKERDEEREFVLVVRIAKEGDDFVLKSIEVSHE